MDNNVMFHVGDVVCVKPVYNSPMGICHTDVRKIKPMKVTTVLPDLDAENRVGENGCANVYQLRHLTIDDTTTMYQYELMFWVELREYVINANEEYTKLLKEIW